MDAPPTALEPFPDPNTESGFREILDRARNGDKAILPFLRKLLEDPRQIERFGGNLARTVEVAYIKSLSRQGFGLDEALFVHLRTIRDGLLGPQPTMLERLLADRVVACWLQVHEAELRYAKRGDSLEAVAAADHLRRMESAHKRHLSALKALADVRKLALPALQINVAERQVNVAAPADAVAG